MTICRLGICLFFALGLLFQPSTGAAANEGVIEGSLSYPSEFIPDDMTICAENLATKKIYCTNKHLTAKKYRYKVGYKLTVPTGNYHVFAQLPDPARYGATMPKDYRAYYSQFVKCGMSVECKDHTPIVVTVKSGATARGVDPWDW
jgi:hypothetical protein